MLNLCHASVLVIFSQPFIHVFYFLRTSAGGGIQFGVLGFCNVSTGVCSQRMYVFPSCACATRPPTVMPHHHMQVWIRVSTRVAQPATHRPRALSRRYASTPTRVHKEASLTARPAAGLTLLGAISLLPLFFSRRPPRWPYIVFGLLSTLAFLAAAAAFAITMWLFTVARDRFRAEGFTADYGPSVSSRLPLCIIPPHPNIAAIST